MSRGAQYPFRDDPSWDTAPEYITHHMRLESTPLVRAGGYQYPDAEMITNGSHKIPIAFYPGNHHVPQAEAHKKVQFVEHLKTTEINNNNEEQFHEEKIDIETEADIFIKRKHKNFELARMDTYMVN